MSATDTLLLRADAGSRVGMGHAMRCLALAQAWEELGGGAVLAVSGNTDALERLQASGARTARVSGEPGSAEDAAQTLALADTLGAAWVAVDGYALGREFRCALRSDDRPLLWIDDEGTAAALAADWVLNQNLHARAALYPGAESRLLLGPRYALLRREFRSWRERRPRFRETVREVLITLGGADADNVTGSVLDALSPLAGSDLRLRVVVGPANPHREALASRAAGSIEVLTAVSDMPALMAQADLAVTAAGSTCWELAFFGVPMVAVVIADNQAPIAQSLAQAELAVHAGTADSHSPSPSLDGRRLRELVERLVADPDRRRRIHGLGRAAVDGEGALRVARALRASAQETAEAG